MPRRRERALQTPNVKSTEGAAHREHKRRHVKVSATRPRPTTRGYHL